MSQEKSFEISNSQTLLPKAIDQSSNHSDKPPRQKKNNGSHLKHHRTLPVIDEAYGDH